MQYDFYSLDSLDVKELKAIITQENIYVKSKNTKQELINVIRLQYIENLIRKNFVASYVNPKIVYLDTRLASIRYSVETYNINYLLDVLRKYNPSISILPGETKLNLQYDDIFEVNKVIYYSSEHFLIVELKNCMFMFVNIHNDYYSDVEYEVYVTSFYDKIIQHLTVDQYMEYIENTVTEEELNAYETRDFRIRNNRVPTKQEFLYFLDFYQKIQMDALYWTHLNLYSNDVNYILYKSGNKYHYAEFAVCEPEEYYNRIYIRFIENKSYGTYRETIVSMLPKVYNMYLAETVFARDTKILSHIFNKKDVRAFETLFNSIKGEAIDIRNITKEKTKFFGLENIKKYHTVKLHFDTFELTEIVSMKDRKKSVVIYEVPDYFIAFTFYISSVCKGVEFECVSMMTDIKQYIAYTYEDLLGSFSDSDYKAYYE
jgi:hypothetical protein